MHADPIIHAQQHTDQLGRDADALQAAEIEIQQEIRSAFCDYFAGNNLRRVPTLRCLTLTTLTETTQYVSDAITDAVQDGAPARALLSLLQGTGSVEALQAALIDDYSRRNLEDIAQQRVVFDAPEVHPFLMREAA